MRLKKRELTSKKDRETEGDMMEREREREREKGKG